MASSGYSSYYAAAAATDAVAWKSIYPEPAPAPAVVDFTCEFDYQPSPQILPCEAADLPPETFHNRPEMEVSGFTLPPSSSQMQPDGAADLVPEALYTPEMELSGFMLSPSSSQMQGYGTEYFIPDSLLNGVTWGNEVLGLGASIVMPPPSSPQIPPLSGVNESQRDEWGGRPGKEARSKRIMERRRRAGRHDHKYRRSNSSAAVTSNIDFRRFNGEALQTLRFILQKELKNSDTNHLGRIVLPKREAEAYMPQLEGSEGITVVMRDAFSTDSWTMRYRYWINNKSRMYVLENTSDFINKYDLENGDFIFIYENENGHLFICPYKTPKPAAVIEEELPNEAPLPAENPNSFISEKEDEKPWFSSVREFVTHDPMVDIDSINLHELSNLPSLR